MSLFSTADDDDSAIARECAAAQAAGREISDGCARAIASQYHSPGNDTAAFSTAGAIVNASELWGDLFLPEYATMDAAQRLAADMLGTYILNAGNRGPVPGWSEVWVR